MLSWRLVVLCFPAVLVLVPGEVVCFPEPLCAVVCWCVFVFFLFFCKSFDHSLQLGTYFQEDKLSKF